MHCLLLLSAQFTAAQSSAVLDNNNNIQSGSTWLCACREPLLAAIHPGRPSLIAANITNDLAASTSCSCDLDPAEDLVSDAVSIEASSPLPPADAAAETPEADCSQEQGGGHEEDAYDHVLEEPHAGKAKK